FPEFNLDDKREITLRQLITHTSGLPAWRPLYLTASNKEEVLPAIAAEPLESQPGTHFRYSDLGFITLGFLLEKLARGPFAEIAQNEIFGPLKLTRTFFNPDKALITEVAACELGNAYEHGMCDVEKARSYVWRDNLIWGEVHDGNAYFLGGAAGHAG